MEDYLKASIRKMKENREAEKKIQKRFEGPGNDSLLAMSLGKMIAYDYCIKELEMILESLRSSKDFDSLF